MKIIFISDTHGGHDSVQVSEGDVLVHAGDFGGHDEQGIHHFVAWLKKLPHKHKIVIAGNHDVPFGNYPKEAEEMLEGSCIYLNNSGVEIDGIHFWGSPDHPLLDLKYAFGRFPHEMEAIWKKIPEGTDVLITHGPPNGIFDEVSIGRNVGCDKLLEAVKRVKPKVHVFGHIHEGGGGMKKIGDTLFINAAIVNRNYQMANRPIVVDL